MSSDTLDLGERDPWIPEYASIRDAQWIRAEAEDSDRAKKMLEKGYVSSSEEEELGGAVDRLIEKESLQESILEEAERDMSQMGSKRKHVWCFLV